MDSLSLKHYTSNSYPVTTAEFITAHRTRLIANGPPVDKILKNSGESTSSKFSDNVEGLNTCLDFIYDRDYSIREDNYKSFVKFGVFFKIRGMLNVVDDWIKDNLSHQKFWEVYIELRSNENTALFIEAIDRYLNKGKLKEFERSTKQLIDKSDLDILAAVAELLSKKRDITGGPDNRLFPVVLHLAATVIDRREEPGFKSPANMKCLQTVVSCIVTYIAKHGLEGMGYKLEEYDRFIQQLENLAKFDLGKETSRRITDLIKKLELRRSKAITRVA